MIVSFTTYLESIQYISILFKYITSKILLFNYQLISLAIVLDNVTHVYPYTYFINRIHLFLRMQFLFVLGVCECVNIRIKNHRHFLTFYLLLLLLQLFVTLVASKKLVFVARTPTKITLNKIETFPWHKIYVILWTRDKRNNYIVE